MKYTITLDEYEMMTLFHSLLTEEGEALKWAAKFKGAPLSSAERETFQADTCGPGNYGCQNMLTSASATKELYNKLEKLTFRYI